MKYIFVAGGILICLILTILKFKRKNNKKIYLKSAILKCRQFLFLKSEEEKFIRDIVNKVANNVPNNYKIQIDYSMLKNAGLFRGKPIFKVYAEELNVKLKQQLFLLNKLSSKLKFDTILMFKNYKIEEYVCKHYSNIKCLNINEINAKLLFEINKININYDEKLQNVFEGVFVNDEKIDNFRYKNFRLESKTVLKNCGTECYKILIPIEGKTIFEKDIFNEAQIILIKNSFQNDIKFNLQVNIKLQNEFVNFEKIGKKLAVKFFDGNERNFYFSNDNFDFFIKKCEKNAFLSVKIANLRIKSNSYSFMTISSIDKNFENYKNILLENYCSLKQLFELNFKSENLKLNNFINKNLADVYCKHFLKVEKNNCTKFEGLTKIEQLDKLSVKKINSFSFVKFLFDNFLGVSQKQSCIKLSPNSDIKFFEVSLKIDNKIYQIIYQQNKQKFVSYGGLEFVNLDNINLKFVDEKHITFCG